jgi:N-acetylglucosaminyldiphosphoundecaprenol N-acetyl-beta-D-mannosaminyltransferase
MRLMSADLGPVFDGERDRVDVCGLRIDRLSFSEALARVEAAIERMRVGRLGRSLAVFSANVDMIVKASRDPVFAGELNAADLLLADGTPVLWMARGLGHPLPQKISGSDLVPLLAARAAMMRYSLFLLGSTPAAAGAAAERLQREHPGLCIAGVYSPPVGFERDPRERDRIRSLLRAASPDVVLVGLGAPKQERWILAERDTVPSAVMIAVGGTFDLLAGDKRRAPAFVQHIGLEWMWRLAQEPLRLGRRYLVEDPAVIALYARALRRRARRTAR